MSDARALLVFVSFAVGLALGCADRQASEDSLELLPVCQVLPAWGHWSDGGARFIQHEDGSSVGACTCMSADEYWDNAEDGFPELLDRALASCKQAAARYDFEWDECEQNNDSWPPLLAVDDYTGFNVEDLDCEDELEPACKVGRSASPWGLLVVAVVLGLRRRRQGLNSADTSSATGS